jgi:hypothetical protein
MYEHTCLYSTQACIHVVRFEVPMAVTMRNAVFWDVAPRGSCKCRRSVLQLLVIFNVLHSSLILPFHPDEGIDTFFRNVRSYKSHTASHPRRRHSSCIHVILNKTYMQNFTMYNHDSIYSELFVSKELIRTPICYAKYI